MRAWISWKIWSFLAGVFLTVALFVLAWVYPRFPGDEPVLLAIQGLRTDWLDTAVLALTTLGNVLVALPLMGLVILGLILARRRADALIVAVSMIPIGFGNLLKIAVGRPRPDYIMAGAGASGLSFPSGHSLYALLFGGVLIVLANDLIRPLWIRRWVQVALAALVLAIGMSRIYLGVHWPSDVIGAFLFAGVSLVVILTLRNTLVSKGWQPDGNDAGQ